MRYAQERITRMPDALAELERRRTELLREFAQLAPFRPGCITALVRRCGKPGCRCSEPEDPGHGPNLRLTYKSKGKTYSESLATPAVIRKAEREVAEFRKFQQLMREFIQVNTDICRARRPIVRVRSSAAR
jgi:Family of unknown function (DUF6788)